MNEPRAIPHSLPTLGGDDRAALDAVLASRFLAPGERARALGERLAERYGCRFGIALNSCTSALHLALLALNINRGDRVAVPALVCPTVCNPIAYVGAEVVLVDVRPADHQVDVDALLAEHDRAPLAAVVVPHRYGHRCDLSKLRTRGLTVIDDDAQALGAVLPGPTTRQGIAAVFSFYATKMIATGCGGGLVTDDAALAERVADLSDYYAPCRSHDRVRYNYRMPDLNAAVGLAQLDALDRFVDARRTMAARYAELLGADADIVAPVDTTGSVWYRFVVRMPSAEARAAVIERSRAQRCGIGAVDMVDQSVAAAASHLRIARCEWDRCVSLPIYPELSDADQQRVAACVIGAA